ncbi:MAG: deoxycytidylate deaminase [Bacteroidales bacterium]
MMNDHNFMEIAKTVSQKSKCIALQVGAVIVRGNIVISTGYNGTPIGVPDCDELLLTGAFSRANHHDFSNKYEVHAEMNALMMASRKGEPVVGCVMYVTHRPCDQCLKNIAQSGITRVVYKHEYNKCTPSNMLLDIIEVCKIHYDENTEDFKTQRQYK